MKMVQVENGEILQYQLPKVGRLKDGSSVGNYDVLPLEILLDEGWLPLEDIPPEYNIDTQYLVHDGYNILVDKVVKKYKVEDITIEEPIEPEPSEIDILKDENEKLKTKLQLTEQLTKETSANQEELIEMLIEMGVI